MDQREMYAERLRRAQSVMAQAGIDCLVVGPSADLLYILGAHNRPSERMAVLLVPREGTSHVVLPFFEAPTLPGLPPRVEVVTWGESDNPAQMAGNLIASFNGGATKVVAVSDRLWAVFLIRLQAELQGVGFTSASPVLSALREVKSPEEVELLAESGRRADEVFDQIRHRTFAGRSELDLAREIASLLEAHGLEGPGTPIVASGPNSASPHHHAGERIVQDGDVVVLDFGGTLEGYYSDITRTVFVGAAPQPNSEEERVYTLVSAAQEAGVRAAVPGMTCERLDAVARDLFVEAGYGEYFIHRLGTASVWMVMSRPTSLAATARPCDLEWRSQLNRGCICQASSACALRTRLRSMLRVLGG